MSRIEFLFFIHLKPFKKAKSTKKLLTNSAISDKHQKITSNSQGTQKVITGGLSSLSIKRTNPASKSRYSESQARCSRDSDNQEECSPDSGSQARPSRYSESEATSSRKPESQARSSRIFQIESDSSDSSEASGYATENELVPIKRKSNQTKSAYDSNSLIPLNDLYEMAKIGEFPKRKFVIG